MLGRDRVGRERAAALGRPRRGVDALLVEERARGVAELGGERRVGVEHELLGVLPVDGLVVAA